MHNYPYLENVSKLISTLLVFAFVITILATLVTSPALSAAAVHDIGNQKSKNKNKPKDPKCNNVQVLLKVSKIPKDSKLFVAQATLDGKTIALSRCSQSCYCFRIRQSCIGLLQVLELP